MQIKTVARDNRDSVETIIRTLKRSNQMENLASTLKNNRYYISPSKEKAVRNAIFRRAKKHARRRSKKA